MGDRDTSPGPLRFRLWCGGLKNGISDDEVMREMGKYGDVDSILVRSSAHDTFAFVQFTTDDEIQAAINALNNSKELARPDGFVKAQRATTDGSKEKRGRPLGGEGGGYYRQNGPPRRDTRDDYRNDRQGYRDDRRDVRDVRDRDDYRRDDRDSQRYDDPRRDVRDDRDDRRRDDRSRSRGRRDDDRDRDRDRDRRDEKGDETGSRGRREDDKRDDRRDRREDSHDRRGDRSERDRDRDRRDPSPRDERRGGYDRQPPSDKGKIPVGKYKITVENVPEDMSWVELKDLGRDYGPSVTFARTYCHRSKWYGMLEFKDPRDGERCVKELDGRRMQGLKERLKAYLGSGPGDDR